jgi:hypothetical protein
MAKKDKITVAGIEISIISDNKNDYISLTDMAGYKDELEARVVVSNWMSTHFTLDFLGIWEQIYNPNFNRMEFHTLKTESGRLVLTPKRWVERTNAIGIFSKSGRYGGGIFAHKDIAFEFGSWLSAEFKFYLIKEFQRLKEDENQRLSLEWNLQRTLAKVNYQIHTSAISQNLIPKMLTKAQINYVYANEADLLNVALFGMTAKEWRNANPNLKGNMRDYATINELICLSNMENINAVLINDNVSQSDRLQKLNAIAIQQMSVLQEVESRKMLK